MRGTILNVDYLLNPRRGTLQTSRKSITQSEESFNSTLISNPVILIMLKNIRADIQKQTKPKYKDEKYGRVQMPIDD